MGYMQSNGIMFFRLVFCGSCLIILSENILVWIRICVFKLRLSFQMSYPDEPLVQVKRGSIALDTRVNVLVQARIFLLNLPVHTKLFVGKQKSFLPISRQLFELYRKLILKCDYHMARHIARYMYRY